MYISNNAYSGLNSLRGGLKHSYWAVHHFLTRQPFNLKVESHHVIIRFPEICSLAFRTPFLWIPMFFHTLMGNVLVHLSISFLLPIRCPKGYLTKGLILTNWPV